jgi:hypothetical protein
MTIKEEMQENIEDYTLKTNEELIDILIYFGSGETEFHTADVERLIRENDYMKKKLDNSC